MTRDATLLNFDSDFNYLKIALSGSTTNAIPTFAGSETDITIDHNLGYIPAVKVWFDPDMNRRFIAGNSLYQDVDGDSTDWTNGVVTGYIYLTTTQLVIGYANLSGSSKDVTTYYRIYYDA